MAKILVVDDEPAILSLIRNALRTDQHLVTVISDSTQVRQSDLGAYDLIMLDVMMPGVDGFTLCREIRAAVDCPILFLTAKTQESDLMYGLGLGADDYIVKPFGIGALRARIDAHLRREGREKRKVLYLENIHFNLSGKELFVQADKVPLTKSEYEICEFWPAAADRSSPRKISMKRSSGMTGKATAALLRSILRISGPS